MARHDDLVRRLARIEEGLNDQRVAEMIAERIDVVKIAAATLGELGFEDTDMDAFAIVSMARFLVGEVG